MKNPISHQVYIGEIQDKKDLVKSENRKWPIATWTAFWHSEGFISVLAVVSQPWRRQTVAVQVTWLLKNKFLNHCLFQISYSEQPVCNNIRHNPTTPPPAKWILILELLCLLCTWIPLWWVFGRFIFQGKIPNGILADDKEYKYRSFLY